MHGSQHGLTGHHQQQRSTSSRSGPTSSASASATSRLRGLDHRPDHDVTIPVACLPLTDEAIHKPNSVNNDASVVSQQVTN